MRLIDADALEIDMVIEEAETPLMPWYPSNMPMRKTSGVSIEQIDNAPTIDATPIKHGHWLYDYCDIVCSECGTRYNDELCYMLRSDCSYNEPRYCPWCGARMDAKE